MSFQDEVLDWDHGQLVREVLRARAEIERLGALLGDLPVAPQREVFETPEHELCAFTQDAARRCFEESRRIASSWYGRTTRGVPEPERRIANALGEAAEILQRVSHEARNLWWSGVVTGWRT